MPYYRVTNRVTGGSALIIADGVREACGRFGWPIGDCRIRKREYVIWKYTLPAPRCTIDIPEDYHLLGVGHQGTQIVFWAEVDPSATKVPVEFAAVNTGDSVPEGYVHLGTIAIEDIIWHIFKKAMP